VPRQADGLRAHAARIGNLLEDREAVAQSRGRGDPAQRTPGQERNAELVAQLELRLAAGKRRRELVLHRGEAPTQDLAGGLGVPVIVVGTAGMVALVAW